jgi:hypothetical protein
MSCQHPRHPAIKHDGTYCCEVATNAASHALYFEPLNKDGRQLHHEEAVRSILSDGVRREEQ